MYFSKGNKSCISPCCRCKGLILLETYTTLEGGALKLPDFLTVEKEVTGDPAYSMFNLSFKKMCPWIRPTSECTMARTIDPINISYTSQPYPRKSRYPFIRDFKLAWKGCAFRLLFDPLFVLAAVLYKFVSAKELSLLTHKQPSIAAGPAKWNCMESDFVIYMLSILLWQAHTKKYSWYLFTCSLINGLFSLFFIK